MGPDYLRLVGALVKDGGWRDRVHLSALADAILEGPFDYLDQGVQNVATVVRHAQRMSVAKNDRVVYFYSDRGAGLALLPY